MYDNLREHRLETGRALNGILFFYYIDLMFYMKGKERKGRKEKEGKERKGEKKVERKGNERKGNERKENDSNKETKVKK